MKPTVTRKSSAYRPAHLGRRSRGPCGRIDRIPWSGGEVVIELSCDEFTSLCPVTGQPDFGALTIRYAPGQWLVESKSLKLYLWQYRERGIFNEELVAAMADDLAAQLKPVWLEVCGRFKSRGGIAIAVTARRPAPGRV
jgi:7-cyano-7-deazaguanine reductase